MDAAAHLAELELVEDRRLTSGVEADHEDAHLLLAKHPLPDAGEGEPHFGYLWGSMMRGGDEGGGAQERGTIDSV